MEDGSYKILGSNGQLLGYVRFRCGSVETFSPNRLGGAALNDVYTTISSGQLGGFELVRVTENSREGQDWHAFYTTNTDRRRQWELRKESERRKAEWVQEESEKKPGRTRRTVQLA